MNRACRPGGSPGGKLAEVRDADRSVNGRTPVPWARALSRGEGLQSERAAVTAKCLASPPAAVEPAEGNVAVVVEPVFINSAQ